MSNTSCSYDRLFLSRIRSAAGIAQAPVTILPSVPDSSIP